MGSASENLLESYATVWYPPNKQQHVIPQSVIIVKGQHSICSFACLLKIDSLFKITAIVHLLFRQNVPNKIFFHREILKIEKKKKRCSMARRKSLPKVIYK